MGKNDMTQELDVRQCQSGDGLSGDGKGMCQREGAVRVELSGSRQGEMVFVRKHMCKGCAAHWALLHPTTVRIL